MNLKQLQQHFQSYILNNDLTILQNVSVSTHASIYQNAYYERIINAMKQDFPVLSSLIGDSAFASMVTDYLKSHPSTHFNLRYVGKNLSDFILSRDAELEAYADLAKSEWLVCEAELHGEPPQ